MVKIPPNQILCHVCYGPACFIDTCIDMDALINPDADEIPNNGVDENCAGVFEVIDEDINGFNSDEDQAVIIAFDWVV